MSWQSFGSAFFCLDLVGVLRLYRWICWLTMTKACALDQHWLPIDGSRSDGVSVALSRLILAVAFFLAGCQSAPLAVWQTASTIARAKAPPVSLVPGMRFLQVVSPAGVAYMALGDLEPSARALMLAPGQRVAGVQATVESGPATTSSTQATVEVWYSAGKQVLRLEQGRVVSTAGLPVDWRSVRTSARPAWSAAVSAPAQYYRVRDEMPGYRFGLLEQVMVRSVQRPSAAWAAAVDADAKFAWFTEESVPWTAPEGQPGRQRAASGSPSLPLAWFAVDLQAPGEPVVFSRQCLSSMFCLDLQPLAPVKSTGVPAASSRQGRS